MTKSHLNSLIFLLVYLLESGYQKLKAKED
ncbi:hypothetical protein SAMN05421747_104106 [Parapedobacter composti]|uniref:Uncharacterized protein n=1 Tax=Parapedobacter composti TaxID=623281 RepID=A0A1I1GCL1_9SPHI|nr:hypothetical protein SAMN05421747_104106 [Parapedobacter composti]